MSNINAKFVIFKLFATAKKLIKFRNCQYFYVISTILMFASFNSKAFISVKLKIYKGCRLPSRVSFF